MGVRVDTSRTYPHFSSERPNYLLTASRKPAHNVYNESGGRPSGEIYTMHPYNTAISRNTISAPLAFIEDTFPVEGPVLDYGCGYGIDVAYLSCRDGIDGEVDGYDPNPKRGFTTRPKEGHYQTVLCTYVLNVVDEETADSILRDIDTMLRPGGVAYISVRRDKKPEEYTGCQRHVELDLPLLKEKKGAFALYRMEKR